LSAVDISETVIVPYFDKQKHAGLCHILFNSLTEKAIWRCDISL